MVSLVDPRAATAPSPSATKNSTASKTRRNERGDITFPCQRLASARTLRKSPSSATLMKKPASERKIEPVANGVKCTSRREIDHQRVERIRQHPAEMVDDPQQQKEAE